MKWHITNEHDGMMIRDFLRNYLHFSRRILISVKTEGKILVNGNPVSVREHLQAGDVLEVQFPKEEIAGFMHPEAIDISIVYEDDALLIVNKPANMATIPSLHHPGGTVANGLLHHYREAELPYTVHVVTRLDRDTSGLVLIAKHRYSHSLLAKLQKSGKIKRKYRAVVEGKLAAKQGTIRAPIGRKEGSIIERTVTETGKDAITHYSVLKASELHSYIDIDLETGRTHQIRVHFSHIGHPLAGDDLYGGSTKVISRQALHCYYISFEHPFTRERVEVETEVPEDMQRLIEQMEK